MLFRHILFLLFVVSFPLSSYAKDSYNPVTAWQVAPLSVGAFQSKKPSLCVMTSKFDDGTVIRFTGGKERIPGFSIVGYYSSDELALGVSFLGTDNMATEVRKLDDNTIMGKFVDSIAVYKILESSAYNAPIIINFNGEEYKYFGGDIKAGLLRIASCLEGGMNGNSMGKKQASDNVGDNQINFEADITLSDKGVVVENHSKKQSHEWEAKRGEDLRDVLYRWSQKAGTDLIWSAEGSVKLPEDIGYDGDFNEAVQALLYKVSRGAMKGIMTDVIEVPSSKNKIDENMDALPATPVQSEILGELGINNVAKKEQKLSKSEVKILPISNGETKAHNGKKPVYIRRNNINIGDASPVTVSNRAKSIYDSQKWIALKGASLHEVLQAWSEDANLQVKWLLKNDYVLRETVSTVSQFDEALRVLLAQYNDISPRPVAKIYYDKKTGSGSVVIFNNVPDM